MAVHCDLMNKIIVDCDIAEIKMEHNEGNMDSPQIRLIPDQAYRLISIYETCIMTYQRKDTYQ